MLDADFFSAGERAYLYPELTYPWGDIVLGVYVRTSSGTMRRSWPVEQNTWRGFHKLRKECPGAGAEFKRFFLEAESDLIAGLRRTAATNSVRDMDEVSDWACQQIGGVLNNVQPKQLASYNKIRKPVDLYLAALCSMASELDSVRARLAGLLFLPLDSWIMAEPSLLSDAELHRFGLSRGSTYSSVHSKAAYEALQSLLSDKASTRSQSGRVFHRIYFDLIWNERWRRSGRNLYEYNF